MSPPPPHQSLKFTAKSLFGFGLLSNFNFGQDLQVELLQFNLKL
ncbi:hypothetical protein RchiOBHm_Chr2g0113801 [Rosa chinensis]|uniref:Uncharacterized protein n=1 Tax=Rosa chinensis TaxID=74649 RepID=A0A2P6RQP7_ROSCH|nr:hypothetical protein RchiOBHm_Chr2g0113801 [Rosa chinensis]